MKRDILKKIKSERQRLQKTINKYGMKSKETRIVSDEMDKLIQEYYESTKVMEYPPESEILENYKISYRNLKEITSENKRFPTIENWNKYAKTNKCLNHITMQYISKLDWNYLRTKVLSENNLDKF